ncbi:succinate---hydroxymethylglutarate CoA-transferase, partial [Phenoliferia sp. Uapishka_3]
MPPPLKNIRIVDLTRVLAGPYAAMLLADLGADVIKIEHPTRGDDTRAWNPPSAPLVETPSTPPSSPKDGTVQLRPENWNALPPESTYFLSVNRNKRSVGVNLKAAGGLKVVQDLIRKADVLIENYVPGKLNELGLSYEACKAINPKLIYASITGYGQTGPYSKNPGYISCSPNHKYFTYLHRYRYDVNIEAEAGLMHITGEASGPPVKVGVAITDLTTGLYVHGAIMAALISRGQTGKGVWIDCSLFESQVASLTNLASNYLIAGQEATRQGTSHPSIVPYQNFATKDGFIMIGAGNDSQFKKLSALLGEPEWSTSDLYSSNGLRVANRTLLVAAIHTLLAEHTTTEWLGKFKGQGFPHAPVNDLKGTFAHPQAIARKVVEEVVHPRAGKIKLLAPAVCYDGKKMEIHRPPPVLGQHTVEVLREELGYDDHQIHSLQEEGAI